ncbi:Elongation factor [Trichinella spiralis]|uniref:Elongation factor n=2 Tax=Trichinella spiralis TaxID=6334 RepID=A0ABR3KRT6_TRISP|nr:hypothetical protein T01_8106 [Trichinella spiralis]
MRSWLHLLLLVISNLATIVHGGTFQLPPVQREAPKPSVPADLAHFFQLSDVKTRRLVDSYLPGVIPPASFDVIDANDNAAGAVTVKIPNEIATGLKLAERLVDGSTTAAISPPSYSGSKPISGRSSISGIPNYRPDLPKAPIVQPASIGLYPSNRPDVPEAGLGPLAKSEPSEVTTRAESFGDIFQPLIKEAEEKLQLGLSKVSPVQSSFKTGSGLPRSSQPVAEDSFSSGKEPPLPFPVPEPPHKRGGLVSQILHSVGLNRLAEQVSMDELKALGGLKPPGAPGSSMLSGALYNILSNVDPKANKHALQREVENVAVGTNLALVENLLLQPNSPFCQPQPETVQTFDIDKFTGKWYQVVYSPPLSSGPCSMITYQKVADVGKGNSGTIFDTFEYTTGASNQMKPKIASGYGIVKGPGQLVYRTSNSPNDIRVHIIKTGPLNSRGQYEYVVMTVTCNYPLHVLARDPVQYKIKYEAEVNEFLEKKKLVAGWTKVLNLIAPVDYNFCTFPPTLFNEKH